MATLAEELKRLRALKGWTLRDVEDKTGRKVSNSYLYQLEAGNVKEPSPNILYELAIVYGASYPALMSLAGYRVPAAGKRAKVQNSVAFSALDLSDDEREQVLDFVQFLRRKKGPKNRA